MRIRIRIIAIIVVLTLAVVPITVVLGQGGFAPWLSVEMSGTSDSYLDIEMSGVSASFLTMAWEGLFAPTNFILTLIDDYTVGITWTKGEGANSTMIRAKLGSVPTDREDGYLIYYGTGESTTDDGVDMDLGMSRMYYRAWSQSASEAWETTGISDSIGGTMVIFILFGILALGLVFGFIWKNYAWLAYGAAGVWALLGFLSFQTSDSGNPTQITDVYMGLFWLSIGFVIACSLLPSVMREKPSKDDIYVDDIDEVTGEPIKREESKAAATEQRPRKKGRPSRFGKWGI